jgi:hypothetical protein
VVRVTLNVVLSPLVKVIVDPTAEAVSIDLVDKEEVEAKEELTAEEAVKANEELTAFRTYDAVFAF